MTIPAQVRIAITRAKERGWDVRYVLRDQARQGDDFERPMFQRLFDLAEKQAIEIVLVWKIDRLARSLAHAVALEELLRKNGAAVHSCTEPIDTTTPAGRLVFGILSSAAQMEKEIIRERVRMGIGDAARGGRSITGRAPFGYRKTRGHHLRVYAPEATVARSVFEFYEAAQSYAEAASALNARGYHYRSNPWNSRRVQMILENPIYEGVIRRGGEERRDPRLALLPPERMGAIRNLRTSRPRQGKQATSSARLASIDRVFSQYVESLEGLD